jgi:hypothetical protein
MRISNTKTKTMAFQGGKHVRCKMAIDNKTIEQVLSFNCLSANVSYRLKLSKFQRMCGTKRRAETKTLQTTQLEFYKTVAVPMLTYASENRKINRQDKRRTEHSEMGFLRPVAGYTLLDQKRGTDICPELKTFNLTERMGRKKENLHEHILRMTTDRLPKILLNYNPREHRSIGQPIATWEDIFP